MLGDPDGWIEGETVGGKVDGIEEGRVVGDTVGAIVG